jgi:hypothetical protein
MTIVNYGKISISFRNLLYFQELISISNGENMVEVARRLFEEPDAVKRGLERYLLLLELRQQYGRYDVNSI